MSIALVLKRIGPNKFQAFRYDIKLYIIIIWYGFGCLVYDALNTRDCNSRLYILVYRLMHSNKLYMYVLLAGGSHADYAPQLYMSSTPVPHSAAEFCGPTLSPPS